ncbi:MAG: hypothetical protein HY362_03740 [Candidatus Aenigmarchaeota archaeon]|nr:hypothetical protein [Candidatus Aenigmarchaeota archaeon]
MKGDFDQAALLVGGILVFIMVVLAFSQNLYNRPVDGNTSTTLTAACSTNDNCKDNPEGFICIVRASEGISEKQCGCASGKDCPAGNVCEGTYCKPAKRVST